MSTARPVGSITRTGGGPVGVSCSMIRGVLHPPMTATSGGRTSIPRLAGIELAASGALVVVRPSAGDGDIAPSTLASLSTLFFVGGVGPSVRRFVGGGGGGVAMAAHNGGNLEIAVKNVFCAIIFYIKIKYITFFRINQSI